MSPLSPWTSHVTCCPPVFLHKWNHQSGWQGGNRMSFMTSISQSPWPTFYFITIPWVRYRALFIHHCYNPDLNHGSQRIVTVSFFPSTVLLKCRPELLAWGTLEPPSWLQHRLPSPWHACRQCTWGLAPLYSHPHCQQDSHPTIPSCWIKTLLAPEAFLLLLCEETVTPFHIQDVWNVIFPMERYILLICIHSPNLLEDRECIYYKHNWPWSLKLMVQKEWFSSESQIW